MKNLLMRLIVFTMFIMSSCDHSNLHEDVNNEKEVSRLETKYGLKFTRNSSVSDSIQNVIKLNDIEEFEALMDELQKGIELSPINEKKSTKSIPLSRNDFHFENRYKCQINNTAVTFSLQIHGIFGRKAYINIRESFYYGFLSFTGRWYSKCRFHTTSTLSFNCRNTVILEIIGIGYTQKFIDINGYAYLKSGNSIANIRLGGEYIPIN